MCSYHASPRSLPPPSIPRPAYSRRRASAIILPDAATLERFGGKLPKARVSLIPDPHAEIAPDAFTFGEFSLALEHIYYYVLRPQEK